MTENDQKQLGKTLWNIAAFEKQMRRKAHYVIKPEHLWTSIAHMALTQHGELLNMLQEGFRYIENESFNSSFSGLFSEINLASEKLGKTYQARNDKLCTIIKKIAEGLAEFSTDSDTLGDAYEYLIGQFAAGSGKKRGSSTRPSASVIFCPPSSPSMARPPRQATGKSRQACWIMLAGRVRCC